jgi:hypothetical protein
MSDDERDALAHLVNDNHMCTRPWMEIRRNEPAWTRSNGDDYAIAEAYRAADALLAAGFRRQEPITDAQVEAALDSWEEHSEYYPAEGMRAALEAARAAS